MWGIHFKNPSMTASSVVAAEQLGKAENSAFISMFDWWSSEDVAPEKNQERRD